MLKKVLFVCVGNTCRSQMAEGFARLYGRGRIEARSAGTCASGFVNIHTIETMAERGVDISGQTSDQLTCDMIEWADVVVTLGCAPARRICPPGYRGEKLDWPIEDPLGMPDDFMRKVRDDIERRVRELIDAQG